MTDLKLVKHIILGLILPLVLSTAACANQNKAGINDSLAMKMCADQAKPDINCQLSRIMVQRDAEEISNFIKQEFSGTEAPKPERPSRVILPFIDKKAPLSPQVQVDFRPVIAKYLAYVSKNAWWENPPSHPAKYPQPLRAPAYVAQSFSRLYLIDPLKNTELLETARKAGDFLLASQEATGGVFGFPDWRKQDSDLGKIARKVLDEAQKYGMLEDMLKNGWVYKDPGDGSLYFDNGVAGEALLDLYLATSDKKYLDGAITAAKWAQEQPIVPNFNYNAFSAVLEARIAVVTGNKQLLLEAISRLKLGVLSGMRRDPQFPGHWVDPHNETIVYRMIIARSLLHTIAAAQQLNVETRDMTADAHIVISAIENELIAIGGIPYPESAIRLYCTMKSPADNIPQFTKSTQQLFEQAVLTNLAAKKPSISPAALGCFLQTQIGGLSNGG